MSYRCETAKNDLEIRVHKQYFRDSLVTKRVTICATMGQLLHIWVGFGDRANVFEQHCP